MRQELLSWLKNKKIQIKKWIKDKIKQFMKSKFFLGLLMLTVGIAYTVCWYELDNLGVSFNFEKRIVVENREEVGAMVATIAHASEEEQLNISEREEVFEDSKPSPAVQTIKKISAEYNIDWKMVYAVCLKESGCNPKIDCANQYGRCDDGKSFGPYQIYNPTLDPERKRMAENFEEATRWTIKHGIKFKDNPAMFFKNHNGIAKTTNQWYVDGAMDIYKSI